jgi:hypothetical protein
MPTLLLSSRQTDHAQKLWRAYIDEKWEIIRVHNWRVPPIEATDLGDLRGTVVRPSRRTTQQRYSLSHENNYPSRVTPPTLVKN